MSEVSTVVEPFESVDGPIRVLHVDDEPGVAEVTSRFLERHVEAITTVVETDPEVAVDRVETEAFQCVVSDYQMPGMNGIELLHAVREIDPDLPFILFTGHGSEEVASEAIRAGVTDYLQKGAGTDQYEILAQQVQNAVAKRRAEKRVHTYLEASPDGVVVVDTDGEIRRLNEQIVNLFGYDKMELVGEPIEQLLPERYRDDHVDYREQYVESPDRRPMGVGLPLYGQRKDGSEFPVDVSLSPVRVDGHLEVMASVRDATERKRKERELADLDRINRTLRATIEVVTTATNLDEIRAGACETLADAEPYVFAWFGRVDENDQVVPVARAGADSSYLDAVTITVDESPTGLGPTGLAVRTGDPHAVQEIPEDPEYEFWRDEAEERGYLSSAAIPISYRDTSYGVLNIYADRENAFDDRELEVLEDLGTTIGHAIYRAELEETGDSEPSAESSNSPDSDGG